MSGAELHNVGGTSFSNADLTSHMDLTHPMFEDGGYMADGGMMAKGGMVQHGLIEGDKIISHFDNVVVVENDGKTFLVNLNVGKRWSENKWYSMNHGASSKNSKMADGGMFEQGGRYNTGRSWTLDRKQHNKSESYELPESDRKFGAGGMNMEEYLEKKKYNYEEGGSIADSNTEMLMSKIRELQHHTSEIQKLVNSNTKVEAWVVAKAERSATDLSDITHYIDGKKSIDENKFADGGRLASVEVMFENPEYNYTTSVNPNATEQEIRKYFVGNMFDMGVYPSENFQKVIDIKYNSNNNYAKGGLTEHGLQIGDKIIDETSFSENGISVMNDGKYAMVDLDKGERIEGIYADGGQVNDKFQIVNSKGYFSRSMKTGKPIFINNFELGYTYTKDDANKMLEFLKKETNDSELKVVRFGSVKFNDEYVDGGMMAKGGFMYKNLSQEKPQIVNDLDVKKKNFKVDEVDLYRKGKKSFEGSAKIDGSETAVKIFRQFWDKEALSISEHMNVMLLNRANKVIGIYQHSKGGIAGTVLEPEMIVLVAVKSLAKGVILAHNHPSGNLEPSEADKIVSKKIKEALKLVDVSLLDSLIITENSYYSLAEYGYLENGGIMADGGGVDEQEDMGVQFIDYKDKMIMYEPHYKEYYTNDIQFDSLEKAKKYIDDGSKMTPAQINAYRMGAMADGGIVELKGILKQDYQKFVELLGENIKDKKFRDTIKELAKENKVKVKTINVPCEKLQPTQSEISLSKSLLFPLTSPYYADLYLKAQSPIRIKNNTILTCDNGRYIIDGHHRWSQVYVLNPKALMGCTDFYQLNKPIEGLKATQLGIASDLGYVPTQTANDTNMLTVSENTLKNFVSDNITKEVREVFLNNGIDNPEEHIWKNVRLLKTKNKPIKGASKRDFMPQTDEAKNFANYTPNLSKLAKGGITISDGKTLNVGDLVIVNSKRGKQYRVKEINGKENVKVVYNDGSEYVTTTSDLKKFVFASSKMANGGSISTFNPMQLIGLTFYTMFSDGNIVDVKIISNDNIQITYEKSKDSLAVTKSFTKKELYEMSNGKEVDGNRIFKSKMAKGGTTTFNDKAKAIAQNILKTKMSKGGRLNSMEKKLLSSIKNSPTESMTDYNLSHEVKMGLNSLYLDGYIDRKYIKGSQDAKYTLIKKKS
jgi:DNA repair protein RadC